ncbi:hypothetical protein E3N88_06720 [Mikania micrantha]|uniref:Uncharacterized protein n=1 Tax=Mikania micrantha TaxID=192012 RepID=A0A5N6PPF9_9ASTR|nr:hypothetical protein E3N88_06720 [Mikania micrantha]
MSLTLNVQKDSIRYHCEVRKQGKEEELANCVLAQNRHKSCARTGISPVQEQAEVLCKNRPADCVSPVKEILCMYKLSTSGCMIETVDFGQQARGRTQGLPIQELAFLMRLKKDS